VTVLIHGYVQSTKAWGRQGATIIAGAPSSDLTVRFGSDASGALCIWLGELNKAWSYPTVTVTEVMAKYNTTGASVSGWASGWKVEPVTAFETVSQTAAVSNLAFARSDIARVNGLQAALDVRAPVVSLASLPTSNIGPVVVAEAAEVWVWVSTSYFTGYRSPLCGRPLDGHTAVPLASEVDAAGGLLSKAAYSALWGYAQEQGLVKTEAVWLANRGSHWFSDYSASQFRVPDLRDMLRRFTGTDAGTANARAMGGRQFDAVQRITGEFGAVDGIVPWQGIAGAFQGQFSGQYNTVQPSAVTSIRFPNISFDSGRVVRSSMETRPVNVAYHPRIHS